MKLYWRFLLSFAALCAMALPLAAQSGSAKNLARESMRDLQRLSMRQREALIAEMYKLLFREGAGSPFEGYGSEDVHLKKQGKIVRTVNVPYRAVVRGACFVASNGALYDYYATGPHARDNDPRARELWLQSKATLHLAGTERVEPYLRKQIKDLEIRRAVYLLEQMPPVYRQALFAELLGLCYMENGGDAHADTVVYELEGERMSHKAVKAGARFLDAEGVSHDFHRTYATEHPGKSYHWECVKFCYLHGHMEMFSPFKVELAAMRKHHASLGMGFKPARGEEAVAPKPTGAPALPPVNPGSSLMGSSTLPVSPSP